MKTTTVFTLLCVALCGCTVHGARLRGGTAPGGRALWSQLTNPEAGSSHGSSDYPYHVFASATGHEAGRRLAGDAPGPGDNTAPCLAAIKNQFGCGPYDLACVCTRPGALAFVESSDTCAAARRASSVGNLRKMCAHNLYSPPTAEEQKKLAAALKETFSMLDMNGNGEVTAKELFYFTVDGHLAVNPEVTEVELQVMIDVYDTDDNGTLDFEEFFVMEEGGPAPEPEPTPVLYSRVAFARECAGAEERVVVDDTGLVTLEQCALACASRSAFFIHGRAGSDRCAGPHDTLCRCYCETAAPPGAAACPAERRNVKYSLYKFGSA